jgi:hypothetical protein
MTITKRYGVDWDGNDFFAWNASPDDEPNTLDTSDLGAMDRTVFGAGGSIAEIATVTEYGKNHLRWTTGTSTSANTNIGWDGASAYAYTLANGASARFTVWAKSTSAAYDGNTLRMRIFRSTGTLLGTHSQVVNFADGWVKFTVTLLNSTGVGISMSLELSKTHSSNVVYDIAGVVYSSGTGSVDNYNTGDESRYENITQWVIDATWNIGFKEAYQFVADDNRLTLTLNNDENLWSPEIGVPNPVAGNVRPNRQVRVQAQDPNSLAVSYATLYHGWLQALNPKPMPNRSQTAILTATSSRRWLQGAKVELALAESVRANEIIDLVLDTVTLPAGITLAYTGQTGVYVYPYAFDNVYPEQKDALQILAMAAEAERGKLYVDREGAFIFKNRAAIADGATVASFDNDFIDADYVYGDKVINDVQVAYYPRKISSTADKVLWTWDQVPVTLAIGETKVIRASFSDEDKDKRVAGKTITHTITFTGFTTGVTVTLNAAATSCEITIANTSGATRTIASLVLKGYKITSFNRCEVEAQDATSITNYGSMPLKVDNPLTATDAEAKVIAEYIRDRFEDPRGRMKWIKYVARALTMDAQIFNRTVWDRVEVVDGQTSISGKNYLIIGEEHRAVGAATSHEVTWYLERVET